MFFIIGIITKQNKANSKKQKLILHKMLHYLMHCRWQKSFSSMLNMSSYFRFQAIVGSLIVATLLFCDAGTKSRPHSHKGVRLHDKSLNILSATISKYFVIQSSCFCRFSHHSPVIILHTIYLRTKTKN